MILEKILVLNKFSERTLISSAQFTALLLVAVLAPLSQNQIITGTIVNVTLFLAASTLGLGGAVLIALLPSSFALLFGTLPMVHAPLLPFIILSNILLILVVTSFKKNKAFVFLGAAVLKFIFLYAVSTWAVDLMFDGALVKTAYRMFTWPQLITAVSGGVLAYIILNRRGDN